MSNDEMNMASKTLRVVYRLVKRVGRRIIGAEKVLVYCGIHDCRSLCGLRTNYDRIFGFDANPDKVAFARKLFANDPAVTITWGALTEEDGGTIVFYIPERWDASSSLGTINPDFPPLKDQDGRLHDTPVKKIEVPRINLFKYFESHNLHHIHTLISDLQGMDLTVLQTLSPMLKQKRIRHIISEVEKDQAPNIYPGLPSNKQRGFDALLTDYKIVWVKTSADSWESDIHWKLKG